MEAIVGTFHIDWKIVIAQMINFAIVYAVLYLFAFKPLMWLMKTRAEKITQGLDDAKKNAEVLANTQKEYDAMLAKARKDAAALSDEMKKADEARSAKMKEVTQSEISTMLAESKKALEAEKVKLVDDVRKETVPLVMDIVKKVLGGEVPHAYEQRVVEELKNLK